MFDPNKKCPLLNKKCLQHDCQWFVQLMGTNPQTGQEINEFGCAIAWMPILSIENTQKQNQTGAAIESLRNHVVEGNTIYKALQEGRIKKIKHG